jgi:nitrogen regulatory protein PII
MNTATIPLDPNARIITCILPQGRARHVEEKLFEKGLNRIGVYHARGIGPSASQRSSVIAQTEKDVLVAVVTQEEADEVFTYLYEVAEIYKPHNGFVYMQQLTQATPFLLPEKATEEG